MNGAGVPLRWGIIGPGLIADRFAAAIAYCPANELLAIGTRDPSRANFTERFPGARVHHGYAALLSDDDIDVVYIATPHPHHAEWAIKAANAGKHVLCEKPMGLTVREGELMFEAARQSGKFMGEGFMYRFHPLTASLLDILRTGRIGRPVFVQSSFAFVRSRDETNRRIFDPQLAGGGIYDVGVYPVSMARLVAGIAEMRDFSDPVEIHGVAHVGETGVDEWAAAVLRFPDGLVAEISCGISIQLDNVLRIYGARGQIAVRDFWFGSGLEGGTGFIHVLPNDAESDSIVVEDGRSPYVFEVEATARAIAAGMTQFPAPGMSWNDTLGNMRTIEAWRASSGIDVQQRTH